MTTGAWAILLAGGDGTRLQSLTRRITGDTRPKQFCALVEGDTLLARTQRRVTLAVRPDRQVVIVNRDHAPFFEGLGETLLPGRLVIQPDNRGTAAGIVYPLVAVRDLAGDVPVAIFPTDHDVADDRGLMATVEDAIDTVERRPDRIVLLGVEAEYPETEYGWIETAPWPLPLSGGTLFPIVRFWEKPSVELVQQLYGRGCLWNSFIMVGRVQGFLELVAASLPGLLHAFGPLGRALGSPREAAIARRVYASLPERSFAEHVLARTCSRLLALRLKEIGWTDLGSPAGVMASLRRSGRRPAWLDPNELASTA